MLEVKEGDISLAEWLWMRRKLLTTAKKRAKAKGIEFSISLSDIQFPENGKCPILGVPLKRHRGKMERHTPSLDRKDSTKGYVPGNVFVVSWWANYLKEQMTLEQAQNMVEYIRT
jgi:hypothetical protein